MVRRLMAVEHNFRVLFDLAADSMFVVDSTGIIMEANQTGYELLGYTKAEMLGRHVSVFVPPEYATTLENRFAKAQREKCLIYESAMVHKSGSVLPMEIALKALEWDGQMAFLGIVRDIRERKLMDAAMRESEARFRTLAEDAPEAIVVHDLESGLFVDATTSAERLFGCSREEILRHGPAYFYAQNQPDDAPLIESIQVRGERIIAGEQMKFERLVRTKSGKEILCEVRLVRLPSETRKLIRASYVDITERKQSERLLAESEKLYRTLIMALDEGVVLQDENSSIIAFNKSAERILGLTSDQLKGKSSYDPGWRAIREDGSPFPAEEHPVVMTLKTGLPQSNVIMGVHTPAGALTWISINVQPIFKEGMATPYRVVATMHNVTERKLVDEKIVTLAFYDTLTGLPNRQLLMDRLRLALASTARSGKTGALLLIDLDNFKTINDTLGHDVGDALLQQVAQRLWACIREVDTVARLGGDEFVVMLEDLGEDVIEAAEQAKTTGEKIIDELNRAYPLCGHECRSTASLGAVLFRSTHMAMEDLLKQADIAMYQAKKEGRNTLRFFDPQMQESINARALLEAELRHAIEKQQFQLYYQIQVDGRGHPLGAEALIRWAHPGRGLVAPMEFIPLAEETGLILPIGQWVIETACAQIKAWEKNSWTRDLGLSVNVSASQFHQPDFVAQTQAALERHGINPNLLTLELTEGIMLKDTEDTIATMNTLKKIGVQFALDDFGSGYSSLQYLKRLPLHQLKIDRSFIRDIAIDDSDKAIVRTVIAMAQSLNLGVIAEGVETEEQRQFLLENGCSQCQGYLFSWPVPIEQFESLLRLA